MSGPSESFDGQRWIKFVEGVTSTDTVMMKFRDPAVGYAVLVEGPGSGDVLEVVLSGMPSGGEANPAWSQRTGGEDASPPILVRYRGVEVIWRPGYALVQCDREQASALLLAVVEFTHYERELARIEAEIADGWAELDEDRGLAFEAKPSDLKRSDAVGERMALVLARRMRHARIEPHLFRADARLAPAGQKLGEELREKAGVESRLEAVSDQLEVFEHVYEMSGQRLGEFRASRQEHVLEWVIIVLLAAETFLLLGQAIWRHRA